MSKTVIIGGVAGGATAAARLRRKDESMEIIMFERGEYISYANCGLPYYIGDVIKSRDALLLQTPAAMKAKFNIDVRTSSEVQKINRNEQTLRVQNLKTGEEYEETYDTLIIATGSSPLKPPIPGIKGSHIYTLWTIPDTDAIKEVVSKESPKRAAVIGGGFIGLEMAENLRKAGIDVTIIEMLDQVMAPVDYEMAQLLHENIRANQVELILKDGVDSFQEVDNHTVIHLKSGKMVTADMVLLSIGVRPNSSLAKEAGLELNARGGIVVDEFLRTSDEHIYAVGDVIEVNHSISCDKTMIPLAGPANKQGRICADNITGNQVPYKGTMGTSVAQVFDLTAAAVGLNEKALKAAGKQKGRDYETVLINQKSHAGYYPGAAPITLKLIFDRGGSIYGAQIIGQDGVDKRIDTIAVTMRLKGTVNDLAELELAYAPPYSSAKDPVNMLGFTAQNVLEGLVSFIEYNEMDSMIADQSKKDTYTILDVTEEVERMVFSIPGSVHIPLGKLRSHLGELDKSCLIIPYCSIGVRSYNAARILMQNGFTQVKVLSAGTSFYKSMHNDSTSENEKKTPNQGDLEGVPPCDCKEIKIIDCCGLQCPGPIMKVHEELSSLKQDQILQVSATDMGFTRDIEAWCRRTGNILLKTEKKGRENIVYIKKEADSCECNVPQAESTLTASFPQGKTLIVFSGDLDKVLASFIIANGAAAMGRPVTMFFTFWGLNALRKKSKQHVSKTFVEKMFGFMMPRGVSKLKLSKMNIGGMGTKMMKKIMRDKNVSSLEELMKKAMASGIKLVACTMSMEVMGIKKEELIDGVEFAGVISYLGNAEEANVNLFV
ncbi:FAD-dependent oxidoreductase [Clostridium sp. C105KSO13]|uniref:FAD-dependent oxidoreductase n=1 Tax=Clostridium sp. C105KSO13 TaxID=1776045 RepID=UPI000740683D|nr:FAD-dependent oxidoreductase [Clostridium sp. C105KSO13]CUX35582.1 Coenzyme A disulfide reductase [Clostridium sp. C105KSO13]